MKVPWAIPNINKEDIDYVKNILDTGWYTMGKQVKKLEDFLSTYTNRKHAIAVNNGTAALEVSLRTMGIGHDDEVIVPALSYIASATSVSLIGATPVFVDVNETMTIDPNCIDDAITNKTKAIMAVDITGNPCCYLAILKKAMEYNIQIIVDGAQSLGSTYNDRSCISYGLMATTSFHAAKILTTVEGGMIFTDDDELAKKARSIRSQGESDIKYIHKYLGGNYRMTDISAAFAIKQIERYEQTLENRRKKVEHYKKLLRGIVDFLDIENSNNFIFTIFWYDRDKLAERLKDSGIDTRKIYPITIPQQPIYDIKKKFPTAEQLCKTNLSLPLYESLTFEEIEYVCEKVKEALK